MNWERIEEFSCLHPMYSQECLNPDPPIPLLPVSRTENLYGMCCYAQLSCRVRGGIMALGGCSFLQPLFISVNPAPLFFPDPCPSLVYLGSPLPVSPRREKF